MQHHALDNASYGMQKKIELLLLLCVFNCFHSSCFIPNEEKEKARTRVCVSLIV